MKFILIIIGGGSGALFRYLSTHVINNVFSNKFLIGTLFVNCIGSFLIGFLMNIFEVNLIDEKWKLFIITGFLGGYTTFSAYSFETVNYFFSGNFKFALMNIFLSNILCFIFVILGIWLNRIIFVKLKQKCVA